MGKIGYIVSREKMLKLPKKFSPYLIQLTYVALLRAGY